MHCPMALPVGCSSASDDLLCVFEGFDWRSSSVHMDQQTTAATATCFAGPVPTLHELHVTVSAAAMRSQQAANMDSSDEEDSGDDETDEGVLDRVLTMDESAPAAGLRLLEQQLVRPLRTLSSPGAHEFELREHGNDSWPAAVTAMRERRFRPIWDLPAAQPQRQYRKRALDLAFHLDTPLSMDGLEQPDPGASGLAMEMETALVRAPAFLSVDEDAQDGLARLLHPFAPPNLQSAVDPLLASSPQQLDGLECTMARVLAPISSARQRAERAQQLLDDALRPLTDPGLTPPPCSMGSQLVALCGRPADLTQAALGGELREMEMALQEPRPAPAPEVLDPALRFMRPRPLRVPVEHPASGVPREVLDAHERSVLERLVSKGDL